MAVPELPTVPDHHRGVTAKLEKIADSLATLPLDELARSMISTIDEARRILKSPEVARSLKSLDVALAESRDLVRHADELVTNVNAQVGPLGSDARATLKSVSGRARPGASAGGGRPVGSSPRSTPTRIPCSRPCKRLRTRPA